MSDERTDIKSEDDAATPGEELTEINPFSPDSLEDRDATIEDLDDAAAAVDPDAVAALQDEWGVEFDANLALAREAAQAVADDDLVTLLEENGLGNDPRIVRAAARIGRLLRIGAEAGSAAHGVGNRDTLEATLDELSRRPDYWCDRIQSRVRQIHLALHGDEPIAIHRTTGDGGGG